MEGLNKSIRQQNSILKSKGVYDIDKIKMLWTELYDFSKKKDADKQQTWLLMSEFTQKIGLHLKQICSSPEYQEVAVRNLNFSYDSLVITQNNLDQIKDAGVREKYAEIFKKNQQAYARGLYVNNVRLLYQDMLSLGKVYVSNNLAEMQDGSKILEGLNEKQYELDKMINDWVKTTKPVQTILPK